MSVLTRSALTIFGLLCIAAGLVVAYETARIGDSTLLPW